jgi:hypothetical protein
MSTMSDLFVGAVTYSPVGSFVTGSAISYMLGLLVGAFIATVLWFRWYIEGSVEAIESVANKEWGD